MKKAVWQFLMLPLSWNHLWKFSTDRTLYGSDQAASIAPEGFSRLVGGVREIEKAFSNIENKEILEIEKPVAKKLREHIKL